MIEISTVLMSDGLKVVVKNGKAVKMTLVAHHSAFSGTSAYGSLQLARKAYKRADDKVMTLAQFIPAGNVISHLEGCDRNHGSRAACNTVRFQLMEAARS